jgi:replication initiator protein RepSA
MRLSSGLAIPTARSSASCAIGDQRWPFPVRRPVNHDRGPPPRVGPHREDDPRLGTPLCPDCFQYERQVLWNRFAPALWQRTVIYLPRTLARLAGTRVKDLRAIVRKPEFAKVSEFQLRGAIHFHAIFRLDGVGPDGAVVPPPPDFTAELLAQAIEETVRAIEVTPRELEGRLTLRWGSELHVRAIRRGGPEELTREAVAAYVAKYATKGSEGLVVGENTSEHISRLVATARELDADPQFATLRLDEAATELGFRGQFCTRSRRYSTTLGAKRRARKEFARRRHLPEGEDLLDAWGRPEGEKAVAVEGRWRYAGSGYRTKGEEWLALSAAARAREWRRIARDEARSMTQQAG